MSDLKNKRYSLYIIDEGCLSDVGENCHVGGGDVHCKDILSWIEAQRKQFGMNDEKILKQLVEELS